MELSIEELSPDSRYEKARMRRSWRDMDHDWKNCLLPENIHVVLAESLFHLRAGRDKFGPDVPRRKAFRATWSAPGDGGHGDMHNALAGAAWTVFAERTLAPGAWNRTLACGPVHTRDEFSLGGPGVFPTRLPDSRSARCDLVVRAARLIADRVAARGGTPRIAVMLVDQWGHFRSLAADIGKALKDTRLEKLHHMIALPRQYHDVSEGELGAWSRVGLDDEFKRHAWVFQLALSTDPKPMGALVEFPSVKPPRCGRPAPGPGTDPNARTFDAMVGAEVLDPELGFLVKWIA